VSHPHATQLRAAALLRLAALACSLQHHFVVFHSARKLWHDLLASRAGKRFQHFHAAHAAKRSGWARALTISAALICVAVGVVLAFIPGPAVVFFALAVALASTQSHWLAQKCDRAELYLRAAWRKRLRRRRQRRGPRHSGPGHKGRAARRHALQEARQSSPR
jgi:hypothetical protein